MTKKSAVRRAKAQARRGKSPSTQAGEFVREEIDEIRAGEHGAQNAKQAIAIGLAKARRAGVKVGESPRAKTRRKSKTTRRRTSSTAKPKKRARASLKALKKKPRAAASHRALSRHAKAVNRRKK